MRKDNSIHFFAQSLKKLVCANVIINLLTLLGIFLYVLIIKDNICPYGYSKTKALFYFIIILMLPFANSIIMSFNYKYLINKKGEKSSIGLWFLFSVTPLIVLAFSIALGLFLASVLLSFVK